LVHVHQVNVEVIIRNLIPMLIEVKMVKDYQEMREVEQDVKRKIN